MRLVISSPARRPRRWIVALTAVAAMVALAAGVSGTAPDPMTLQAAQQPASADVAPATPATPPAASAGETTARALCVTCHTLPPPNVLPRSVWLDEVSRMYLIAQGQTEPPGWTMNARAAVSLPPQWKAVADYYAAAAPERLKDPPPWPSPDGALKFRRRSAAPAEDAPPSPAVAHVRLLDYDGDERLEVVSTDMRHGVVMVGRPYEAEPALRVIARVPHPAHIEPIDLDGDGIGDFLVGDLGRFLPSDHREGAVVWLRGRKDGTYGQMSLDGWPRVSDVEAADFDADGRRDFAVAAFGWRRTGDFTILKNDTASYDRPSFLPYKVDPRTGAIHAVPADVNADGQMDVIVLFAQEHETVVAFINRGGFQFTPATIYTAPHPNWGSSGIQVVDTDKDGDLDVLMTHGDTFDDQILKPYHGIQLLENRGTYPFVEHDLANMAGVHRAQAADMDGDGDLDIVACALVSSEGPETAALPALVWLEQVKPGIFEPHTLEKGLPQHATLDVADFDRDGDADIVVGNFSFGPPILSYVDVWENFRIHR
jgi:cytochrome c553